MGYINLRLLFYFEKYGCSFIENVVKGTAELLWIIKTDMHQPRAKGKTSTHSSKHPWPCSLKQCISLSGTLFSYIYFYQFVFYLCHVDITIVVVYLPDLNLFISAFIHCVYCLIDLFNGAISVCGESCSL